MVKRHFFSAEDDPLNTLLPQDDLNPAGIKRMLGVLKKLQYGMKMPSSPAQVLNDLNDTDNLELVYVPWDYLGKPQIKDAFDHAVQLEMKTLNSMRQEADHPVQFLRFYLDYLTSYIITNTNGFKRPVDEAAYLMAQKELPLNFKKDYKATDVLMYEMNQYTNALQYPVNPVQKKDIEQRVTATKIVKDTVETYAAQGACIPAELKALITPGYGRGFHKGGRE